MTATNQAPVQIKGGSVYMIRSGQTGLHKIGRTHNWSRRSRELGVGVGTVQVEVREVEDSVVLERLLHSRFKSHRLPQSEWFSLNPEDIFEAKRLLRMAGDSFDARTEDPSFQLAVLEHARGRAPAREQEDWDWKIHQHKLQHSREYAAEHQRLEEELERQAEAESRQRLAAMQARQERALVEKEADAQERRRSLKAVNRIIVPLMAGTWGLIFFASIGSAGFVGAFVLATFLSMGAAPLWICVTGVAFMATGGAARR